MHHIRCAVTPSLVSLLVSLLLFCGVIQARQVILNEEDITGSCERTCTEMPTKYDFKGKDFKCKTLSGCTFSSKGWLRGFVDCNNCKCECEQDSGSSSQEKDAVEVTGSVSTNEDELYGTCTGTCGKSGLVKTNFKGWQEISDCKHERNGWTRFPVRCDYCTCTGTKTKYAAKYTLKDMNYDYSNLATTTLNDRYTAGGGSATVNNCASTPQTATHVIRYTKSSTTSVSTTRSLTTGIGLTINKSFKTPASELSIALTATVEVGLSTEAGKSNTTSEADESRVDIKVPAGKQLTAYAVGRHGKVELPYTATLVITYDDGSTKEEPTSGKLSEVTFGQWDIQYMATKPADTSNCDFPADSPGPSPGGSPSSTKPKNGEFNSNGHLFGSGFNQYDTLEIRQTFQDVTNICLPKCQREWQCTGFGYSIDARYDGRTNGNCWFMTGDVKWADQDKSQPGGLNGGGVWIK